MVLFFYAVGQLVMVRFADAGARLLLSVALASYTGRVVVLGLVLLLYAHSQTVSGAPADGGLRHDVAVVAGWLVVEIVFSRLRISVYDTQTSTAVDGPSTRAAGERVASRPGRAAGC